MNTGSGVPREINALLHAARQAMASGRRGEARRILRELLRRQPDHVESWLMLASLSEPRAALAYAREALELDPDNRAARILVREQMRRIPRRERVDAAREARLPDELTPWMLPLDVMSRRRLFSPSIVLATAFLVAVAGLWWGSQRANAEAVSASHGEVPKATFTSTPTQTPTPTATPTITPTPTVTPLPSPTPTATLRPVSSSVYSTDPSELAGEGRWIDVDLSEQRVTAYEGATAVRTFIVSTGVARYPTLTGQYRVYLKLFSTPMSGPGYYLPGVPYTMYYDRGYALHGTYWHSNFGTPMSHGCINLYTPDAEWLFNFASIGTLVNIHP